MLLVTALAIGAFFVPAALAIRSAQEREDLLELQREASVVASHVPAFGPIDETALEPIISSEHRLGLYAADGSLIGGIGPSSADRIVEIALAGNFAEGLVGDDLVAAVPVRALVDGSSLVMRIEAPRSDSRRRFLTSLARLGAAAAGIFALAAAVGVWVTRRLNRPIDQLRRWAADARPDRPPPDATGIVELDSLRADLITDRERIAELLERERSFSSQVSHQLRTPVTAMRVAVETELAAPRGDPNEILQESLGQLDRLESTIVSLLALARHDVRTAESVDLIDLARERTSPLTDHHVDVVGHEVMATTDPAAIGHIIDVLVDNAIRHGRGDVRVSVGQHAGCAIVEVSDDGPTPSPASVFSDNTADAGHGIGLRLARMLAESIGAELTLLDGPTTTFRLSLPTDDSADTPKHGPG